MDPGKVRAVTEWPTPSSRRGLQQFLGFANFYRRFIRNYSSVAAPLTALTSSKCSFEWGREAEKAFSTLKSRFTTAPILTTPDPAAQFVLEVDASDTGVGAILSQRSPTDNKMRPCAFFHVGYRLRREIMASKTGSYSQSSWLWRSGGIGLRVWIRLLSCGLTTRT